MGKILSKIKLQFVPQGKVVTIKRFKKGHKPENTQFNWAIINFGKEFNHLKNCKLPLSKRLSANTPQIMVLMLKYPGKYDQDLRTLTRLANLPNHPFLDSRQRLRYQQSLANIFSPLSHAFQDMDSSVCLLMERGALLTGAFYSYPDDQSIKVIAKRLDFANGTLGLGLTDFRIPPSLKTYQKLHIIDDCIASGDSIAGTVFALWNRGYRFKKVTIDVAVAVQTGAEFVVSFLHELGIEDVVVRCGSLCYQIDEHFYLRRTEEEGYPNRDYYVGDMGAWSTILPTKFDKIAPWNNKRLDYPNDS